MIVMPTFLAATPFIRARTEEGESDAGSFDSGALSDHDSDSAGSMDVGTDAD